MTNFPFFFGFRNSSPLLIAPGHSGWSLTIAQSRFVSQLVEQYAGFEYKELADVWIVTTWRDLIGG